MNPPKLAAEHLREVSGLAHSRQIDRHIEIHAPRDRFDPARTNVSPHIQRAIAENKPVEAIVLTADIRRSSAILKESLDIPHFAGILDDFVGEFRTTLSFHNGWFDKFTGDGFICYWLVEDSFDSGMELVLTFAATIMEHFRRYYYPAFIANMRNVPTGIGLSLGIDAGPCHLVPIAGDLTLVGAPIVGSVRMADAARSPYELLINTYAGRRLTRDQSVHKAKLSTDLEFRARGVHVSTKEYPDGQGAYSVIFTKDGRNLFY